MSNIQKIIKYFAIALAVLLIFNIISGIMYVIISLSSIFSVDNNDIYDKLEKIELSNNIFSIDIDVSSVNIIIKNDNKLKLETNSKNVKCKTLDNKLFITEKKHNWFNKNETGYLILYVDEDILFNEVIIENGAGTLEIDNLNTKELELDLGAGRVSIDKLNVSDEASISGGAGEISIINSSINNLDLDLGVGRVLLEAILTKDSEINAGIGEIDLNLLGKKDDYKINIDKGLGTVVVDGNEIYDKYSLGSGSNLIDISGGIGSVNVNFN